MNTEAVPTPPEIYQQFVERYPKLEKAWEQLSQAGREGPLDAKTVRLIKLGIAIGGMRQGAVGANVRKALAKRGDSRSPSVFPKKRSNKSLL